MNKQPLTVEEGFTTFIPAITTGDAEIDQPIMQFKDLRFISSNDVVLNPGRYWRYLKFLIGKQTNFRNWPKAVAPIKRKLKTT